MNFKFFLFENCFVLILQFLLVLALSGGEDYELLFTIKQEDFEKIKGNPNLSVIGHMTTKGDGANLVTRGDEVISLKAQGWKAF